MTIRASSKILDEVISKTIDRQIANICSTQHKYTVEGENVINLSSTDYLGFSQMEKIKFTSASYVMKYGVGSGGSRLLGGGLGLFTELEKKCALWLGYEEALFFGNGFMANLGFLSTISMIKAVIIYDKLSHASIIDGVMLSKNKWRRFIHNDTDNLKQILQEERLRDPQGNIIVITESVFSMGGDLAPLREIDKLCKEFDAMFVLDESHAIGVFGQNGTGLANALNVKPDVITFACSKGLGSYGGFCVGTVELKQALLRSSRAFIFSSALPPSIAGSVFSAIDELHNSPNMGDELIKKANYAHTSLIQAIANSGNCEIKSHSNGNKIIKYSEKYSGRFDNAKERIIVEIPPQVSQIIPILFDNEKIGQQIAIQILHEGVFVKAIRPPSVKSGTSRIRLSICNFLSMQNIAHASQIIAKSIRDYALTK